MDLLATRYANPFFLLDEMAAQGRLFEFVCEVNLIKNEERLWEVWLNKVWDNKDFDEWKESLRAAKTDNVAFNAKSTVKQSFDILKGFCPE